VLDKDVCPETRWVEGSNYVDVNFKIDKRTNRIIMMGAMDNLVKGAAGQAVQNMNLMFGLKETEGLELVNMPNGQNFATKTMKSFFTNFDLVDNDQVSVVIYNANGVVVSKKTFMVENSSFIRDTDINTEYVSHISLKSPFISNANPKVLEIRKNTPISSLELTGVVCYNSGRTRKLPVDNTKFSLRGLESFIATIEGQTVPVVLTYTLSSTEVVYGSDKSTDKFLVEPYKIVVRNQLPVYVLKLLCFPVWINAVSRYPWHNSSNLESCCR
jgi:hypothetical protein